MKVSFVDIDGIRTRYLHDGSGEGLLLIHGFGLSADAWAKVLDPLAERYAVFAPDILGHGFTDWVDPGEEAAPLFMARHLARFMDAVGIEKGAAVGSSLGGVLAPLLYFERPQQVTRLVIDGLHTPVSDTGTLDPDGVRATMANGTRAMTNVTWQTCIDRMANICFDRKSSPADIALIQVTIYAQPDRLEAYTELGENFIAHADDDAVRIRPDRIKIPTLFLCGRQDIRASIEIIEANHQRIEGAKLVAFENCGHLPEIEHPEKFVATLRGFLGS